MSRKDPQNRVSSICKLNLFPNQQLPKNHPRKPLTTMLASKSRGKTTLMATAKQIAANRLNSKTCCGPRTATGRLRSSQNALKTGLYAKSEVTAFENHTELEQLKTEFHN